jgi:hypothetical protein
MNEKNIPSIPSEYDPATCVTAGELRALGFPIPEGIPDVAWCPRSALLPAFQSAEVGPDGKLSITFNVQMMYPMRWIQLDMTVEA